MQLHCLTYWGVLNHLFYKIQSKSFNNQINPRGWKRCLMSYIQLFLHLTLFSVFRHNFLFKLWNASFKTDLYTLKIYKSIEHFLICGIIWSYKVYSVKSSWWKYFHPILGTYKAFSFFLILFSFGIYHIWTLIGVFSLISIMKIIKISFKKPSGEQEQFLNRSSLPYHNWHSCKNVCVHSKYLCAIWKTHPRAISWVAEN